MNTTLIFVGILTSNSAFPSYIYPFSHKFHLWLLPLHPFASSKIKISILFQLVVIINPQVAMNILKLDQQWIIYWYWNETTATNHCQSLSKQPDCPLWSHCDLWPIDWVEAFWRCKVVANKSRDLGLVGKKMVDIELSNEGFQNLITNGREVGLDDGGELLGVEVGKDAKCEVYHLEVFWVPLRMVESRIPLEEERMVRYFSSTM